MYRYITFTMLTSVLSLALVACGNDDSGPADIQTCDEVDFMAAPLSGAGYDPEQGFVGETQESYIAHTTFLVLDPDGSQRFDELVGPIFADLATREGLVAYTVGMSQQCGIARTMGLWTSEQAMYDFVLDTAHAAAMAEVDAVSLNGATTHWTVRPADVPMSWETARAKIAEVEPLY
ncbi:hypothetical protein [Haliangium sp.]|uniref:hypothetical protein n=1 Tax=Haliangium sp. TaxID=2663208 RepID=UPI003D0C2CA5